MASIQVKRGTRAQLEAAKPASGLAEGEPYLITDEGRLAVGTAANAYSDAALKSEVDAKLPLISGQSEINAALADDDVFAAYDTSATAHKKSLMSRVWTYISGKITGAISGVLTSNLTASRAVVSDGSGKVSAAGVTSTELGYVSGVTSAVQTQLNAKAPLASPALTGTATAAKLLVGTTTDNASGAVLQVNGNVACKIIYVNGTLLSKADDTVAAGDSKTLTSTAIFSGLLLVRLNGTEALLFVNSYGPRVNVLSDPGGIIATSDVAGKHCVYFSGGSNSPLMYKNNSASATGCMFSMISNGSGVL